VIALNLVDVTMFTSLVFFPLLVWLNAYEDPLSN